jgi:hypothetical protein
MKTISMAVWVSFLVLSGLAVASQSGEQKDHSSRMEEMMKGENQEKHMDGMMRMMKMMELCSEMMESHHDQNGKVKETDNK